MNRAEIELKLKKFTVGIAGAGGLGSNCAVALVRAGIKNLIIADFDIVNKSNLNRQFYFERQIGERKVDALKFNLQQIYSDINIETHAIRVTKENAIDLFKKCDVVVEAFDSKVEKQMIVETILESLNLKPLVVGSGMAGWGENNTLKTESFDNVFVCGDGVSEIAEQLPPLGPRVGVVANMQANQVLEILLGKM